MGATIELKEKRYIVITGCYRSGTVALFNIVRLIMKHTSQEYDAYLWEGRTISQKEYQIIKTHNYNPKISKMAYRIFVAHRKLKMIKKSMNTLKKGIVPVNNDFKNVMDTKNLKFAYGDSQMWLTKADYIQNFGHLTSDIAIIFIGILNNLGIFYKAEELESMIKEFSELKAPRTGHDKETLLTETHKKFQ